MQEDDGVLVLDCVEVDVRRLLVFEREPRHLEVVGGEERERPVALQELPRDGPGEGESVEGRSAAPDLVHQHQAPFGRVVEDIGRFGHLDHEGRAPAREVVGRTDAREDLIDRPEARRFRRNERAHVRHQHDERDLAHVSGLAAHVGPGDEEQLALGREPRVVGDEGLDLRFDDRVAARVDLDENVFGEFRPAIVAPR